jgi:hypothetical protein
VIKLYVALAVFVCIVLACDTSQHRFRDRSQNCQWQAFSLPSATEAIDAKLPVCFCMTTDSTIGASPVVPPVISDMLFELLTKQHARFFEIRLNDLSTIPDSFATQYLKRRTPSLSIVSAQGAVYSLSGTFTESEVEELLRFVLGRNQTGQASLMGK